MTPHTASITLTVPGPHPKTPWGKTANVLRFVADSIGFTRQLFQTYGSMVSLHYGGGTNVYSSLAHCPGTVFVYGPEFVRQVATQHEIYYKHPLSGRLYRRKDQSARTEPLQHFVVGLFGVNSDRHRQHRQLMMPAFHRQQIEQYRDDIVAIAQSTLDGLTVGETCDISQVMRLLTMRVATKTLFGEDIGERGGSIGQLLQDTLSIMGSPSMSFLPFDLPGLPYRRFLDYIAQLDDAMREMIAHKRAVGGRSRDVLSLLLQARDEELGTGLTEDEVLGHAGVIFAAGHETSSNALTWTLFLLSQHPKIAADLLDELTSVLQGDAPTVAQLAQLPLLERVVKESMRVLSPVPWNARVTSQPTELGGYALPQGTEVFVSITQTHHMPELYPDPEAFQPQRWETITPTAYEYNPFSAGPRLCIGAGFAMMEIKLVLAMLIQRYRLEYVPQVNIERVGTIVMSPKHGMPMRVHPPDQQWTQGVGGVRGNIRDMVNLPA
ncbi:cytochrome P450 [Oculatella sp. LEGE 06141]|uniref:cytochrome P450 n=1 Tax=Oculatella sp. LEGE 06141 TaxID=1828648 RepID=UPI00187E015E|nr:cytochrome P450 [Oculatella sp. LEGE 06141]MBE9182644.1 cytochrome P450 [Oculatella sp. LEGE 06141]